METQNFGEKSVVIDKSIIDDDDDLTKEHH